MVFDFHDSVHWMIVASGTGRARRFHSRGNFEIELRGLFVIDDTMRAERALVE
jgi:hypothetical protein